MLRSLFISLSKSAWAKKTIRGWKIAWRTASRFVAGERLEDAIHAVKELNAQGINATLDHLGESVSNQEEAKSATEEILHILDEIDRSGIRSNVSIKLTQIGLVLDKDLCKQNLARILERAKKLNNFVRIDMEDSSITEITLQVFRDMRERGFHDLVGIVIQSYLYRSEKDVTALVGEKARIRLCKGAYDEPAHIAFPKKRDVDKNYDRLVVRLIDGSLSSGQPTHAKDRVPPITALATHDEKRIAHAKAYAHRVNLPKEALEFQMLYGIRRNLQEELVRDGFPVRVYVPYGREWYPYFMRRLAERPANLWFFLSNFFRG
ncbi:MAG: proline dehydrogenase family protein [Chloroflexota bacterium]